ncbi:Uncharacterised protein [Dermatophilus congolensis]|uniref:Uncharacterized protein n=1 Tax=Dermatophilus congolensis TaxID=1863 RepID=A0A239VEY4_9MICO|nr:Uncharacterised protein [Dermatophilus congolensis]
MRRVWIFWWLVFSGCGGVFFSVMRWVVCRGVDGVCCVYLDGVGGRVVLSRRVVQVQVCVQVSVCWGWLVVLERAVGTGVWEFGQLVGLRGVKVRGFVG